ncbi:phosphatidylinositol-specific phospholipase C1-like protein [Rhabdothermincola sp.]|uniref:phosphatidylinositol-specific phospholipase C1-like protein n=1 Tax=Rhabdothermincola sp. TaxID=2820405 RepID=UPI002FE24A37
MASHFRPRPVRLARLRAALGPIICTLVLAAGACSSGSSGSNEGASTATSREAPPIRLNQIQVIGSHNSYHVEPPPEQLQGFLQVVPSAIELAYTHEPLAEQFSSQGVRQIELDVFADPDGTLWRPLGTPGFKVFHIEQVDEGSRCETFVSCLEQVKAWSGEHPGHLPIAILVEVKDSVDFPNPPNPVPVGPAELDALDAEIRSVFEPGELITPDDVRGDRATLEEAVLAGQWPLLDDVRGRVMFLLDNKRDEYVQGHPSLEGRVAFTPSEPGQPDAAFIKRNDPLGENLAQIQELVRAGYVVRTRADSPVTTPSSGDRSQLEAALASGAQWISTDYPLPGMAQRWGSDYVASIPGGMPARCNPVNAPPGCEPNDLEDLDLPLGPWAPESPPPTYPRPTVTAGLGDSG